MKISSLLLCALLAAPVGAIAAPADQNLADQTPAVAEEAPAPGAHDHAADDGHDHDAKARPDDGPTDELWRRSDAAFHAGDFAGAVELHRQIVKIDPGDVESYGAAAWLLWSMEKGADADAFIAQGLKSNPDNWEMWQTAGDQYGLERKPALERDAYAKAIDLAGKSAGQMLRRRFAHAAEKAGDLPASAQAWRGLVVDFPDEAINKDNLARVEARIEAGKRTPVGALGFAGLGALSLLSFGAWRRARRA